MKSKAEFSDFWTPEFLLTQNNFPFRFCYPGKLHLYMNKKITYLSSIFNLIRNFESERLFHQDIIQHLLIYFEITKIINCKSSTQLR